RSLSSDRRRRRLVAQRLSRRQERDPDRCSRASIDQGVPGCLRRAPCPCGGVAIIRANAREAHGGRSRFPTQPVKHLNRTRPRAGFGEELLPAGAGNGEEAHSAVGLADAPLTRNPTFLFEAEERWIDGPLIECE